VDDDDDEEEDGRLLGKNYRLISDLQEITFLLLLSLLGPRAAHYPASAEPFVGFGKKPGRVSPRYETPPGTPPPPYGDKVRRRQTLIRLCAAASKDFHRSPAASPTRWLEVERWKKWICFDVEMRDLSAALAGVMQSKCKCLFWLLAWAILSPPRPSAIFAMFIRPQKESFRAGLVVSPGAQARAKREKPSYVKETSASMNVTSCEKCLQRCEGIS